MPKTTISFATILLGALTLCGQPSPITLNPAALSFTSQAGSATLPAAQTMQVQSVPAGINFTVSVSGSPFNAA